MIDITTLFIAVITVFGGVFTAFVVPRLKANMNKQSIDIIINVANAVVLAVEQIYINLNGPQKKALAVEKVKNWLAGYRIVVNDELIDEAIESAVKSMNIVVKVDKQA